MGSQGLISPYFLLVFFICVCGNSEDPTATSEIKCNTNSLTMIGPVDEGYTGVVEVVTGIPPGTGVKLVDYDHPPHLEYLELSFTLGDTSATVRTKKPLDADALLTAGYYLYYSIMCDDENKKNNSRMLQIIDLNDHRPLFEQKLYSTTVSELEPVGNKVLRVVAVDADSSPEYNTVTYSVEPASDDFTFNAGAFILKRRLNYNVVQKYDFIVTARDNGGLNDTTTVVIHVQDCDNLNPYFNHSLYQAFIPENQVGSFWVIEPEEIKAQDGDTGLNVALTYSISAVSPDKYQSNFNINSSSGVVTVVTALDREEMSSSVISVSIKAAQTDDSVKTADAVVSVTIEDENDNPPTFDQSDYSVSLLENSPADSVVVRAVVTDLDQGGFVGSLRILPESVPFSISPDGTIRVKNSTALDRETTESFSFQIEAKETDPPYSVTVVPVNITLRDENDNSPTFTSNKYEGKVDKEQTVGMLVVQVEAEDPDVGANGQITYSIDFGNDDGYFSIDEETGAITLAKTIPLEETRILEFPLSITAKDGGTMSRSTSTQVNIRAPGDLKLQFLQKVYHGTVAEEQEPGVRILRVNFLAIPAKVSPTLQVETEVDKFSISSSGEFSTKVKLDYDEAPHNYSVTISISDGVNSDTAVVEVEVTDVNDNSPVFGSSSVTESVPEDSEVGSNVTAVPATDKDSGFNKEIRYSLRGGEGKFAVDPVSGMVSVAAALDRETKAEYNLQVVAEDQGRPVRSATASLLVQVSDINDNVPKFSEAEYQVEVLETESVGKSLLTLSAADPDEGANGRVTYSILQQSPSSDPPVFELDSSSGTLLLVQPLDYSEVKMYSLMVQASDGGTPSLVGNGSVVVKVKDVNNNPPEFSKESYDVEIPENLMSGASILKLEVTDRDQGGFSNGNFLYTSDTFDVSKQGLVSLKKDVTLDREKKANYELQVVAVDQVTDGLTATAQVNIILMDDNDNAPQFPPIPDSLPIPEGNYSEESPGEVFTIVPTDPDLGSNAEVTLSLFPPHPLFRFREDGTLLAVGRLDRESRETYELVVKASDRGSPQRENITSITVSLTDVNDNRPEFSSSSYVSSILLKDAEKGKLLLNLTATDRDAGDNSLISYSFFAGNSPYLALDSQTGAVTLTSDLADVTEDTTLVLTAKAEDHGEPRLSSTARVVISLRVVNLVEGVVFGSSSYKFNLSENQPAGTTVGEVWASSGSALYNVSYTLKTHTDLFSISTSGVIQMKQRLDKEKQEWYILDVEAVDTRSPPTSAFAMVTVTVDDVNEPPQFPSELYKTSVVSIAPYKTPVVQVKASDPDVGEEGQLVYSLSADSPYFDVDSSSGQVFVVSVMELAGTVSVFEVKATDPRGLHATTKVEVTIEESVSSSDVVVMSLNQPANTVEKKAPELEESLGEVLGWTVNILSVSPAGGGAAESRTLRMDSKSLVNFICSDNGTIISSEMVRTKVKSESQAVMDELVQMFGEGIKYDFSEWESQSSTSTQSAVIVLGILLGLSMLGLILSVFLRSSSTRLVYYTKDVDRGDWRSSRLRQTRSQTGQTDGKYRRREQSHTESAMSFPEEEITRL